MRNLLTLVFALQISFQLAGLGAWTPALAESPSSGRALRLPAEPFNYSRIELPEHFQAAAKAMDNSPADNPLTDDGATLGRVLFYDKSLSANGTTSCASCHKQQAAFTDDARFSLGFEGRPVPRNSMSLVNVRYHADNKFFWDQRATSLEAQVLMPIENPIEMGHQLAALIPQLQHDPIYPPLFAKAFGSTQVTERRLAQALAQFVRSIVSYQSPYDAGRQMVSSVDDPFPNFTPEENEGKRLFFGEARCAACHMMQLPPHPLAPEVLASRLTASVTARAQQSGLSTARLFSDEPSAVPSAENSAGDRISTEQSNKVTSSDGAYSKLLSGPGPRYPSDVPPLISVTEQVPWNQTAIFYPGLPLVNGIDGEVVGTDGGLGKVTEQAADMGRFKIPSLRNVAVTGPYMHDGRLVTLDAVVDHYSWSVRPHPNLDERIVDLPSRGLALQQIEADAVVAFLMTLTDTQLLSDERFSDPFITPALPLR